MFQGNNVRDESWRTALFQEMSSAPASMEVGKACDAYGLLAGHSITQADAEQAYIQSKMGGEAATWVRLPRPQWPAAWASYSDPVAPLVLALYGHPDAGGFWERHCETQLRRAGFTPVPEWRSCFWHAELKVFLVVYVDDFKMSGPPAAMEAAWGRIRKHVRTDAPTGPGKYLGCEHRLTSGPPDAFNQSLLRALALPPPVGAQCPAGGGARCGGQATAHRCQQGCPREH